VSRKAAIAVFDIDGVVRDVGNSYRRALADTVEYFTAGAYRPSQMDIDTLKGEGIWNNDWEASQELVYRFFETQATADPALPAGAVAIWPEQAGRGGVKIDYLKLVAFFQSRYRGPDPVHWTGYICDEPLLFQADYLNNLTQEGILWGFFSGATRGSASYVLEKRLGLQTPVLVAMEDAPGKPDPTGLFATVDRLEQPAGLVETPVLYLGDTVADMYTVQQARAQQPQRSWVAVGVLPPHAQETAERSQKYAQALQQAGADVVFSKAQELTPERIWELIN
jgi:HAD superfamily phosphatase